jgi:acetolactate synthase-1/2/3 large subunit
LQASELARISARCLSAGSADTIFGMPGGGNNLELIEAAQDRGMRFVLAHSENSAAMMAGVYADFTRRPATCLVTRGPGAANAVNGIAHAFLDRQAVVLISDTVGLSDRCRISHQRIDQGAVFSPVTKSSGVLGYGDVKSTVEIAISTAAAPRPGPVHLDFDPSSRSELAAAAEPARQLDLDATKRLIASAERPIILLGVGAVPYGEAVRDLVRKAGVPVLQTYRAKGIVPDSWPNCAGLLTGATAEAPALRLADMILAIGVDAVELIPNPWPYTARVISLSEWAEDSPYFTPDIENVGPLDLSIASLADAMSSGWPKQFASGERTLLKESLAAGPRPRVGCAPWEIVSTARNVLPAGSIATVDAGAHMLVTMPLWDTEDRGEVLVSSGLATMGFALPAAIAAAIARPASHVVCFTGDGGLGMCLAEIETVARLGLKVSIVVFNDSSLSLIKLKQNPPGHGGDDAVSFRPVDFAAIGRGFAIAADRVASVSGLARALQTAVALGRPSLIDVLVDGDCYRHVFEVTRR